MKLRSDYLANDFTDEYFIVPAGGAGFSGVVKGNKTLGAIVELLKEETTEEEVIAAMKSRFDAPEGAIERDVRRVIEELSKIGALE